MGAVAALTAVAIGIGLLLGSRESDEEIATPPAEQGESTETTEASTTTTEAPPTTGAESGTSAPDSDRHLAAGSATSVAPANSDPALLPPGLFCRDLKAASYSYSAAVEYWRREGMPDRMDASRNGIPCQTVYPRSDVESYWPTATIRQIPVYSLPTGLLCRDLLDRGVDVYDALSYYVLEGYPTRMDADGNGIPCETVYPDAAFIWEIEF